MSSNLQADRWGLLWAAQKSARYHARRQGFFDRWRMLTSGAGALFGSAAAANVAAAGGTTVTLIAALIVAVLSTIDLVVGTSTAARLHSDLRRRFLEMEAHIRCVPEPSQLDIDGWTVERLRIEADEPPVFVGLDLLCENELARAHGLEPRAKLNWWAKITAHWFKWESIELAP